MFWGAVRHGKKGQFFNIPFGVTGRTTVHVCALSNIIGGNIFNYVF